jgi:hypothetical protein
MATRALSGLWLTKGVHKTTWTGLLLNDDGAGQSSPQLVDRTIQVLGTFGAGGSVSIEGSNDGGTTWAVLNDSRGEGNAMTFTGADVRTLLENPQLIRPRVTAGDGTTNLTVIVVSSTTR